jgi:methylglutaconyl-CoA hydratase
MSKYLEIEKNEFGVATLWLNRPDVRNALNADFIQELTKALKQHAKDKALRCLVLRGRGTHFCAGADLHWMQGSVDQSDKENREDASHLAEMLTLLNEFPTPTLAYVHGGVFGGGIGLMACCDIILSEPSTVFSFSEVKLGLVLLTAESFDGAVAQEINLVHQLVPDNQANRWIGYFADHFLSAGSEALKATKALIHELPHAKDVNKLTVKCLADIRKGKEAQERLKAFFEAKEKRHV